MRFLLILIMLCSSACALENLQKVTVIKVLDGDTVRLQFTENISSLRLVGIDCYETAPIARAYRQADKEKICIEEVVKRGEAAKEILEKLVSENKNDMYFRCEGVDKYGRLLGILYTSKINVNEKMKTTGYCPAYVYKK